MHGARQLQPADWSVLCMNATWIQLHKASCSSMTCKVCSGPVLLYVCKVTKDKILSPGQDLPAE